MTVENAKQTRFAWKWICCLFFMYVIYTWNKHKYAVQSEIVGNSAKLLKIYEKMRTLALFQDSGISRECRVFETLEE